MDLIIAISLIVAGLATLAFLLLLVFFTINFRNRFVRAENEIDNSWAQIDVQLQRRGELIPNLVETVRGYAKHESGTLEAVMKARGNMMCAATPQAKMAADGPRIAPASRCGRCHPLARASLRWSTARPAGRTPRHVATYSYMSGGFRHLHAPAAVGHAGSRRAAHI